MSNLAASFKNTSGFFVRSDSPLSDEQILTAAPSVFAETPHTSRSDKVPKHLANGSNTAIKKLQWRFFCGFLSFFTLESAKSPFFRANQF